MMGMRRVTVGRFPGGMGAGGVFAALCEVFAFHAEAEMEDASPVAAIDAIDADAVEVDAVEVEVRSS